MNTLDAKRLVPLLGILPHTNQGITKTHYITVTSCVCSSCCAMQQLLAVTNSRLTATKVRSTPPKQCQNAYVMCFVPFYSLNLHARLPFRGLVLTHESCDMTGQQPPEQLTCAFHRQTLFPSARTAHALSFCWGRSKHPDSMAWAAMQYNTPAVMLCCELFHRSRIRWMLRYSTQTCIASCNQCIAQTDMCSMQCAPTS
jgi:hypothetical protein